MNGKITYSYVPADWDQDKFLALGGFTVVFLSYNKAAMIEKSVASVLAQDYPVLDILLMDDASADGSGEVMESLARQYRGRHRVRVVRNDENQYITGQWNIAAKLADGDWLGMFCGDDVAHPNRVTVAAERILKMPTLRGFSTASVDIDAQTGLPLPDSHYVPQPYLACGTDSPEDLAAHFASNGATSFWHRSLFEDPLPRVALDDDYLHLRTYILNRNVAGPVFFYDSDVKTIDYTYGVGVTAGNGGLGVKGETRAKVWQYNVQRHKHLAKLVAQTIERALDYSVEKNVDSLFYRAFRRNVLIRKITSGNTVSRIWLLPKVILFLLERKFRWIFRRQVLKVFSHDFVLEFFGVRMASYISLAVHSIWRR